MKYLLMLCLFASAAAQTSYNIPFRLDHNLILVSAEIDGLPVTLIFDSGAERTMVNDSRRIEHRGLLKVSSKSWSGFAVIMAPLPKMEVRSDGLLGQDFMQQFSTITINYKTHTIELEPK